MKTISIINLKGGVAKTTTSLNMAYALTTKGYKVLLVDNDKQGNASKTLGIYNTEETSISDILTNRKLTASEVIKKTTVENLDSISANLSLQRAMLEVQMDTLAPQHNRLKRLLDTVETEYDYCVIDNAPDINVAIVNALVAADEVIIPVKIDEYAFDGLTELIEQIQTVKDGMNSGLVLRGCLITCFQRTDADKQGEEFLRTVEGLHVFDTHIRYSPKVVESTFSRLPVMAYSEKSGATMDYGAFVEEYLRGGNDG